MSDKPKNPGGRPSLYTDELSDKVCAAIATHDCSLNKLSEKFEWFPDATTVYHWLFIHKEKFSPKYYEARRAQASALADSMLDLDRNVPTFHDEKGVERIDAGMIGRAKLSCDIRKWHASKMAPKIWGDQKQIEELQADKERLRTELLDLRKRLDEKNKKEY